MGPLHRLGGWAEGVVGDVGGEVGQLEAGGSGEYPGGDSAVGEADLAGGGADRNAEAADFVADDGVVASGAGLTGELAGQLVEHGFGALAGHVLARPWGVGLAGAGDGPGGQEEPGGVGLLAVGADHQVLAAGGAAVP